MIFKTRNFSCPSLNHKPLIHSSHTPHTSTKQSHSATADVYKKQLKYKLWELSSIVIGIRYQYFTTGFQPSHAGDFAGDFWGEIAVLTLERHIYTYVIKSGCK